MKAIIIDDEPHARELLSTFLKKYCSRVEVIGEAATITDGIALIKRSSFDLLFLDISLDNGTGFDIIDKLSPIDFQVIFSTAHNEFAIKAFQYNAIDYLLKPLNPDELQRVVKKAKSQHHLGSIQAQLDNLTKNNSTQTLHRIAIPSIEGVLFLELNEIIRLESSGKYTTFYYANGKKKAMVSKNLGFYEDILPKQKFYRTDQSHIVNLQYVRQYLNKDGGYVLLTNGEEITVARRRKELLLEKLLNQ